MLAAELSVLPVGDARKAPRRIVNLAAALRDEGATMAPATVLDVSTGGCKIDSDAELEAGVQVWLKLPGLEAKRSRIAWVDGRRSGCEFEIPLHSAEIELLFPRKLSRKASDVFRRS